MKRPLPPSRSDRAHAALRRALTPRLGDHQVIASYVRDWSSATFEGARHRLTLLIEGDDAIVRAARLRRMLAEEELPLAGGFVADIAVSARRAQDDRVVALEALTIVEVPDRPCAGAISRAGRRAG